MPLTSGDIIGGMTTTPPPRKSFAVRMDPADLKRLDAAAGRVPRERWVKDVLMAAVRAEERKAAKAKR
jgi:hypothetical protein